MFLWTVCRKLLAPEGQAETGEDRWRQTGVAESIFHLQENVLHYLSEPSQNLRMSSVTNVSFYVLTICRQMVL